MSFSRRNFLSLAGASFAGAAMLSPLEAFYARLASGQPVSTSGYGALKPKLPVNAAQLGTQFGYDLTRESILALPDGFNYRVLSIVGETMTDGTSVPASHDGMAAFPGPGNTTILVRNHEVRTTVDNTPFPVIGDSRYSQAGGGTTTLVIGPNRQVQKHFVSLAGTSTNCAGGPTPWGSWITCEETFSATGNARHGYTFEVPADANSGIVTPVPIRSMGRFSHEAVAVDPKTGYIYETEDRGDSCFYRFVPSRRITAPGQLASVGGTLYALKIKNGPANVTGPTGSVITTNNTTQSGGVPGAIGVGQTFNVEWVTIDNPDPDSESGSNSVRKQAQAKGAAVFFRGEGAWYGNDLIYFVSTQAGPTAPENIGGSGRGNGQIWAYNPANETVTMIIEASPNGELLDEPDNITVAPFGDLILCEDSSDDTQYLVGVTPAGQLYQFAENVLFSTVSDTDARSGLVGNEFAGACFSPDGRTLFVNIQTPAMTFAIWGPWNSKRG